MLTLTYAVIGYFFGQVTTLSGFGGITGIRPPPCSRGTWRLYYVPWALVGGLCRFQRNFPDAFWPGPAGHPGRPHQDGVTRLQRPLPEPWHLSSQVRRRMRGILNIWWNGQID